MSIENKKTIQVYNEVYEKYIETTEQEKIGDIIKDWITSEFQNLPKDAQIIDIGAGYGRDSGIIRSLGYKPEVTEASKSFVGELNRRGFDAKEFNLLEDDFTKTYDVIFAAAVIIHFTKKDTPEILQKINDALKPTGRLIFTLKEGDGEKWESGKLGRERFFSYWRADEIEDLLNRTGFSDIKIELTCENISHSGSSWLLINAGKGEK